VFKPGVWKLLIGTDFGFNKTALITGIMKRIVISTAAAALIMLSSCELQPEAYFFSDRVRAEIGEEVIFFNGSRDATDFEWDFGDGTFSNAYEPGHAYNASGVFTVVLSAYSRNGNVDRSYLDIEVLSPTMLEIEVLEWYQEYPVANANVRLYPTLNDWDKETNLVVEGNTNSSGKVIFTNLQPRVYYVDVWNENHNNFAFRDEPDYIQYIYTDPLLKNELNQYIAWVDYTGTKGVGTRDRSQVIILKSRSPKAPAGKR
jgi:hypothetical protein